MDSWNDHTLNLDLFNTINIDARVCIKIIVFLSVNKDYTYFEVVHLYCTHYL